VTLGHAFHTEYADAGFTGAIVGILKEELFKEVIDKVIAGIAPSQRGSPKLHTYIQAVGTIRYSVRLG